jgi:DnaJ-class molecular chaperone
MMHEQICQVLGLTAEAWPPDHYKLLGLKRGEGDQQIIEQRVHERMRQLRTYQLSYPDQATEAMNRLAQAYGCLMDPAARQAYDESLLTAVRSEKDLTAGVENGATDPNDPLAWLFGPWDRLAGPESAVANSASRPHFRDWAASAPPPPRRQSQESKSNRPSPRVSPAQVPLGEAETGTSRTSFFWKHSGKLLVILSLLAFLAAAWRTLAP